MASRYTPRSGRGGRRFKSCHSDHHLAEIRNACAADDIQRFAAVAFGDVAALISNCEREGLVDQLDSAVACDAVLVALVTAAKHERAMAWLARSTGAL
jgi:hypothetical protein